MEKANLTTYEKLEMTTQSAQYMLRNIRDAIELIRVASDAPTDISPCMSGVTLIIDHAADEVQVMLDDNLRELKTLETQKVVA